MNDLTPSQVHQLSGQTLAYVGDSVHDLYMRTRAIRKRMSVGALHRMVVSSVRGSSQSEGLSRIFEMLTEAECAIVRRGQNSHAHHNRPRGVSQSDYARATGLEALLGYLYLTGQETRINTLLDALEQATSELK